MKTNYSARRMTGRLRRRWVVLAVLLVLIAGGSFQFVNVEKHHPERIDEFYEQVLELTQWFSDRKARLQTGLDKKLTDIKMSAKPADEDVHFEFYTALPAMQLAVAQTMIEKTPVTVEGVASDKKKSTTMLSPIKAAAAKSLFLDPAELERDFAKRMAPQNYVLQVGVFSTASAADAFREKFSADHFKTEVVKAYVGERHVYRVQLGPFASKEQVETAQHDLRKKGIDGIVRKIS